MEIMLAFMLFTASVGLLVLLIIRRLFPSSSSSSSSLSNSLAPAPAPAGNNRSGGSGLEPDARPIQRLLILYGTQTGTAERFARELDDIVRKKFATSPMKLDVETVDMEQYESRAKAGELANEPFVVVACATYGDGDPTDTAMGTHNYLVKDLPDSLESGHEHEALKGVTFAVFGLGNTQYEHFNAAAKALDKGLDALGAKRLCGMGLGDDDNDIEEDFRKWHESTLMPALVDAGFAGGVDQSKPSSEAAEATLAVPRSLDIAKEDKEANLSTIVASAASFYGTASHRVDATKVVARRELYTYGAGDANARSCVHVELDASALSTANSGSSTPMYETGDHVGVFAVNDDKVVNAYLQRFQLSANSVVRLSRPADAPNALEGPHCTAPVTIQTYLSRFCDLLSFPKKGVLMTLAACCKVDAERDMLLRLSSPEGKGDYKAEIVNKQRSLLQVVTELAPSANVSPGVLLGMLPKLQPRFYSISSASSRHPKHVHITCAVVSHDTPGGRWHDGVASTFLANVNVGDRVLAFIRTSTFRLPSSAATPLLCVGPGTGVAPFRAFVQARVDADERKREELDSPRAASGAAKSMAKMSLYFGCRRLSAEHMYEGELRDAAAGGILRLEVVSSRDGATAPHRYVQDLLARPEDAAAARKALLKDGGHLYVCGDAKHMAADVHRTLVGVLSSGDDGLRDAAEAETWLASASKSGRYQRDVW